MSSRTQTTEVHSQVEVCETGMRALYTLEQFTIRAKFPGASIRHSSGVGMPIHPSVPTNLNFPPRKEGNASSEELGCNIARRTGPPGGAT